MQHLNTDLNADLAQTVMAERLEEARAQRRAAVLIRARRQARRAEKRSRPTRLRVVRAVLRTTGVG